MYKMGDSGVCTTVTDGERVDCLAVVWQQSSVWVGQADGTSNVPIVCHFGNVLLCTTIFRPESENKPGTSRHAKQVIMAMHKNR